MGCKRGQKKLTRKSSSRDGTKRKKKKQDADQRRGWKGLGLLGGGRDTQNREPPGRAISCQAVPMRPGRKVKKVTGAHPGRGMGLLLAHLMLLCIIIFF